MYLNMSMRGWASEWAWETQTAREREREFAGARELEGQKEGKIIKNRGLAWGSSLGAPRYLRLWLCLGRHLPSNNTGSTFVFSNFGFFLFFFHRGVDYGCLLNLLVGSGGKSQSNLIRQDELQEVKGKCLCWQNCFLPLGEARLICSMTSLTLPKGKSQAS